MSASAATERLLSLGTATLAIAPAVNSTITIQTIAVLAPSGARA